MRTGAQLAAYLLLFLLASCGHDDDICNRAADLCGAPREVEGEHCTGDARRYAECIVTRDACDPATIGECVGSGGLDASLPGLDASLPGLDALVPGVDAGDPGGLTLEILRFEHSDAFFDVALRLTNVGESVPVPLTRSSFWLEDREGRLHSATGGTCPDASALSIGASGSCNLQYLPPAGTVAERMVYRDGARTAAARVAPEGCAPGPESTPLLCADGCSNDGDRFVDCDDYDCCGIAGCTTCP